MQIAPDRHAELNTTFSTIYREAYGNTPLWSSELATRVPSSSSGNDYGWLAQSLKMRKWVGPRLIRNLSSYNYQLRNEDYELTVGISRNDYEDDNLGVYAPLFADIGQATQKVQDDEIKTILQAGTTNLSFDGVAFFATTHPLNPAGNQSNLFASTALTAANFDTVLAAMQSITGENGEPIGRFSSQPVLIVPPQLRVEALTIVGATLADSGTGTSGGNTNVLQGAARVLVVPELSNEPTVWYLADTSSAIKPLVWQVRREAELVSKGLPTDDGVFFEKELIWGVDGRYAAGYGPWWLIARCAA